MGAVKIDVEAKSRTYSATYALNTAAGVKAILRDRHKIAEMRYRGDTDASAILLDLHSAIESAGLTERQAEAVAWVYGLDLAQGQVAGIMGIRADSVKDLIAEASERIAVVFTRWNYDSIEVECDWEDSDG